MSVFLRYLASLMVHMMWARTGNKGPVPPIRLPRKGPVNLPVLGPWQMMIAVWMLKRIWKRYGGDVKTHLMTHNSPVANRVGSYLPWDDDSNSVSQADPAPTGNPATVQIPASQPGASAAASPAAKHKTALLPTRRLPKPGAPAANAPNPAKSGSILSKLRGAS